MARNVVSVWLAFVIVLVLAPVAATQEQAQDGEGKAELLAQFEEKMEALAPGDEEAHEELGEWCVQSGLEDKARKVWEKLLAINDKNRAARKGLGYKLVKGKWLNEDEYHVFRGDIHIAGEWMSMRQYAKYLTTKQKVSDWDEMGPGGHRVDTVHFMVFTDDDEERSKEIATVAEQWFVTFVELLNCREAPMPREVANIPTDGVDLEDSVFLALAENGGGTFRTSSSWKMTCWPSGALRIFMPNEDELTLSSRAAFLFKGIDQQQRLVAKTMSADERIRLEVSRDQGRWWKERSKLFGTPGERGVILLPIICDVVVVWRDIGRRELLDDKELVQEMGYRLAPVFAHRFAPRNPDWPGQMIAELFLRGTPSKSGTISFNKVDKIAMGAAFGQAERDGVGGYLNDRKFMKVKAGDRRMGRDMANFPMLYAVGLYAEGQKSAAGGSESMLACFFRSVAEGNDTKQAIETAAGGDFDAFQQKVTRWAKQKSGQRGRSSSGRPGGRGRGR